MRIEIICTGDEVLTGKIINTNFSYMAQKLEDFGLSVTSGTIVGDDREELLAAFRLSSERAHSRRSSRRCRQRCADAEQFRDHRPAVARHVDRPPHQFRRAVRRSRGATAPFRERHSANGGSCSCRPRWSFDGRRRDGHQHGRDGFRIMEPQ